jgi:hypothetical protein
MAGEPVRWSDEVDEVIRGDLTAAAAYITAAGGRWSPVSARWVSTGVR